MLDLSLDYEPYCSEPIIGFLMLYIRLCWAFSADEICYNCQINIIPGLYWIGIIIYKMKKLSDELPKREFF